jgi:hypothetical protein
MVICKKGIQFFTKSETRENNIFMPLYYSFVGGGNSFGGGG